MLRLLNTDSYVKGLTPVTSMTYTTKAGEFHEDGLFSEKIFGPDGSLERRQTFSYIELRSKVVHPAALRIILQLDRRVEKFLSTEDSFILNKGRLEVVETGGVTGINEFIKLFPRIKWRGETDTREKLIKFIENEKKKKTLFIDKIPVIPPDLRPAVLGEDGNWMIDALNDVYISIMRRAAQVRSSGSGPLYDLLNYALQNAVMDHDNYIRTRINKKQGLIRSQMLGKRVDFSGRAVITPSPKINLNELGVPLRLAVGLFEPFILHRLLYSGKVNRETLATLVEEFTGLELSVDGIKRVLKAIKENDKIPEDLYELFFEATDAAMAGRVVVLKRDPVLHTQSYMAYFPVLHSGNTLEMSTLQVGAHNADFDGDQMAVFHPLTDEAQREAKERMTRLTSGTSSSQLVFELSKEMWAGLYIITKDKKSSKPAKAVSDEDLENITDPYIPVKYRGKTTTAGKAIFNSCFPKGMSFQTGIASKKLTGSLIQLAFKKYGEPATIKIANKLKHVAFKWATITAPSMTLDTFQLPKSVYVIKEKIKTATPEEAQDLIDKAQKIVEKELKDTGFGDLVESGSAKGWGQPMQILVAKGVIADPDGNVLDPVAGSFADGLSNVDFFKASQGARKGIIDRVINTADTGYMARRLAYFLNTVEVDRTLRDCKTTRTLDFLLTEDLIDRFTGRFVIKNGKLMPFEQAKLKLGDIVHLRSPVFCRSPKICHTCYGRLIERHRTPYVGILASQIIGERGTQLIMKTFHTGGAVTLIKRDMLSDIINNDPLSGLKK